MSVASVSPFTLAGPQAVGALARDKVAAGATSFLTLLRGEASDSTSASTGAGGSTNLTLLQLQNQTQLNQFKQKLQQALSAAGIDLSQPLTLSEDSFGNIVADASHPDHVEIAQLFESNPPLAAQFRQLASGYALAQPAATSAAVNTDEPNEPPVTTGFSVTLTGDQISVSLSS